MQASDAVNAAMYQTRQALQEATSSTAGGRFTTAGEVQLEAAVQHLQPHAVLLWHDLREEVRQQCFHSSLIRSKLSGSWPNDQLDAFVQYQEDCFLDDVWPSLLQLMMHD